MKINFMCHELSGNGGIETVMVKVLNCLSQDNDITLTLTNIPNQKDWLNHLNNNIRVCIPKTTSKLEKLLFFSQQFIFSKDDICIVLGANLLKLGAKIKKLVKKEYLLVSWIHFSLFDQDMFDPKNVLYAEKHLAISTKIKQQLLHLGVEEKDISLVYNPVEHVKIPKYELRRDEIRLLYIGRILFNGQKNLKELILAISKVKSSKKIVVDMYGTGDDLEKCQIYAEKLGVAENFVWHGWVKNPWDDLKIQPSALILTSKYEGLPMVVLEAETRGIPCITSRFEGYDDIIIENQNGFSYELGNVNGLADIIEKLNNINISKEDCVESISSFFDENYLGNLREEIIDLYKCRLI